MEIGDHQEEDSVMIEDPEEILEIDLRDASIVVKKDIWPESALNVSSFCDFS